MALTSAMLLTQVQVIRQQAALWLTDTCQIKRKVSDSSVNGENVIVYADPVNCACRFIVKSGNERVTVASQYRTPQQAFYTGLYRMQLPYGTQIDQDAKILYGARVFNIIFIPPFHAMLGAFVIEMQEVV